MNCNECYHKEVCIFKGNEEACRHFKNAAAINELPCAIGDEVYFIQKCQCRFEECYKNQKCGSKTTVSTPKNYGRIILPKYSSHNQWVGEEFVSTPYLSGTYCYTIVKRNFKLSMQSQLDKKVFLTLDEAQNALEETNNKLTENSGL